MSDYTDGLAQQKGCDKNMPEPLGAELVLNNRYAIQRFLERKQEVNLYRAIDSATELPVIVKEMLDRSPESGVASGVLAESEWAEKAIENPFRNEFLILRSVSYPTVVKALDIFKEGGRAYLVLEQLEGRDLAFLLRSGQEISVQQAMDWVIQLCQALSQLHRRKILHLDIQARYVVISPDGQRVRLTGFHQAMLLPCTHRPQAIPGYSPPEQFGYLEGQIDERSDIYALGALWHYMLTGNDPESYWAIEEERFNLPDISAFIPDIHPQIERLVRQMVVIDPLERISSVNELKNQLLALVNNPIRKVGSCSDVGMVRKVNEDSLAVLELGFTTQGQRSGLGLYVCADGMGGVNAGEIASALAVDEVTSHVQNSLANLGEGNEDLASDIRHHLQQAVKNANTRVYETGRYDAELTGMGTTITGALVFGQNVFVAHVGDSRCYVINKESIDKITRDHSLVGRLVEIGQLTPEQAANHPQRNLIYRSIGTYPNVEVDLYQRPLKVGDWLLLCSDGLTGHVADEELQSIISQAKDPYQAAQRLVNLANQRGGEDNITVLLVQLAEYS
ncbi:MAG: Stp1/IreP family PP2C-type Ser/Thr phosphatase, partial [Cyanobacteria bacterium NC_groundwater_1444_Ag_S-0.65um_54_12]|nr:Stp1/IreP family PP2C-type Ser/Thr phosphatase [Cyanobacteria bacterium NC_groundwater_1444_Ag_S-0.65um_54_12]